MIELIFLLNPAPPHLHEVSDGAGGTMYEPEFGTRHGFSFKKQYKCARCSRVLPQDEIGFVDGRPLCRRHYEDALESKRKEAANRSYREDSE
jgi:hypothetical protein